MEQRQRRHQPVVLGEPEPGGEALAGHGVGAVGLRDELRAPGRAGRGDEHGGVVVRGRPRPVELAGRGEQLVQVLVGHDELRLHLADQALQLGVRLARVDAGVDGADVGGGEPEEDVARVVAGGGEHGVALRDPVPPQALRGRCYPLASRRVRVARRPRRGATPCRGRWRRPPQGDQGWSGSPGGCTDLSRGPCAGSASSTLSTSRSKRSARNCGELLAVLLEAGRRPSARPRGAPCGARSSSRRAPLRDRGAAGRSGSARHRAAGAGPAVQCDPRSGPRAADGACRTRTSPCPRRCRAQRRGRPRSRRARRRSWLDRKSRSACSSLFSPTPRSSARPLKPHGPPRSSATRAPALAVLAVRDGGAVARLRAEPVGGRRDRERPSDDDDGRPSLCRHAPSLPAVCRSSVRTE